MTVPHVVRRGRRALRRLLRPRPAPVAPDADGPAAEPGEPGPSRQELAKKVRTLRRRAARLGEELTASRAETARLSEQLRLTRASLRDPEPGLPLPPSVLDVVARVRAENLSYLSEDDLAMLARLVCRLERDGVAGLVVEAGTARGGSAIVMAAAKHPERPMMVYDVFGMIPPPTEDDGPDVHRRYRKIVDGGASGVGGDTYYGYRDDLYTEVDDSFTRLGVATAEHRVQLVRGLFADTIQLADPVALAHLDGDWYESTRTCLERIAPLLVPGGRIVLDDYYAWSGCTKAVDEYFADRPGYRLERRAKLHVVRT